MGDDTTGDDTSDDDTIDVATMVRRAAHYSNQIDAMHLGWTVELQVDTATILELLLKKGVLHPDEIAALRPSVEERVYADHDAKWPGPQIHIDTEPEAAPAIVDCAARHPVCQAVCCVMYEVHLTADEIFDTQLRWEIDRPYALARKSDGCCDYLDANTTHCSVWESRPVICQRYTCRFDERIWADFEEMRLTPEASEAADKVRDRRDRS